MDDREQDNRIEMGMGMGMRKRKYGGAYCHGINYGDHLDISFVSAPHGYACLGVLVHITSSSSRTSCQPFHEQAPSSILVVFSQIYPLSMDDVRYCSILIQVNIQAVLLEVLGDHHAGLNDA